MTIYITIREHLKQLLQILTYIVHFTFFFLETTKVAYGQWFPMQVKEDNLI